LDSDRGSREEELRREAVERPATGPRVEAAGYAVDDPLGEPRVRRAGASHGGVDLEEEAHLEEDVRRGARRALDEKEKEESGGGGLYGSQIDSSHIVGAAIAELVGTFILVFGGTAVAVGAILARPTAGAAYDSLAVARTNAHPVLSLRRPAFLANRTTNLLCASNLILQERRKVE
jgi:hypothetical protein